MQQFRPFTFIMILLVAAPVLAAPLSLDVMSFNIRYGSANDGDNSWRFRKEVVVRTIEHYDPVIFGVQECIPEQRDYLQAALPDYGHFGVGREVGLRGESTSIFYKKSEVAILEGGNYWLSETPEVIGSESWNTACCRMATWVKLYHRKSDRTFYYVNTHLDHKSSRAREGGSALIAARCNTFPQDAPVVITGDFNARGGDSEPWTNFIDAGFQDAWEEAAEQKGSTTTWSGFKAPEPDKDRRIDWILYKGNASVALCETVNYNEDGRYPSDHYPVFARISFGE